MSLGAYELIAASARLAGYYNNTKRQHQFFTSMNLPKLNAFRTLKYAEPTIAGCHLHQVKGPTAVP